MPDLSGLLAGGGLALLAFPYVSSIGEIARAVQWYSDISHVIYITFAMTY
jgi:hypothetical protein